MPRTPIRTIRREYILDIAERVMAERGWAGTTFATICQEAEISNGMLTYHFRDKDDLLFALFERSIGHWQERVQEIMSAPDRTLDGRIAALVQGMLHKSAEMREFSLLAYHFLSLGTERPDFSERLRALMDPSIARMEALLRTEVERGTMRRDPTRAAQAIMRLLTGLALTHRRSDYDEAFLDHDVVAMLMGYLTAPGAGAAPREGGT